MQTIATILARNELREPDGRPLYALRVTDQELGALRTEILALLAAHHPVTRGVARGFCLFVAEHFSRSDGSTWWSWESVRRELNLSVPDDDLRTAAERGLRYWGRPLQGGAGRTHYLGTLVCEGGLPLALLRREGAPLRRYFTELLRRHERWGDSVDLTTLARELDGLLPQRMQNDIVYGLAGALVAEIARMRASALQIGDSRVQLPLRLDDDVARDLLNGLLSEPSSRPEREAGILVRSVLEDRSGAFILRRELVVPRIFAAEGLALALACSAAELPGRLHIGLRTANGSTQTVAIAERHDDKYLARPISSRDVVSEGVVAEQLRCVVTSGLRDVGSFVPRGGEALSSELPWVFEDSPPRYVLRAVGSWKTSDPSVVIVLPGRGTADVAGEQTSLGSLRDRLVVRLSGTLQWSAGGESGAIATKSEDVATSDWLLQGSGAPPLVLEADMWRGAPGVVEVSAEGVRRPGRAQVLWRQQGGRWVDRPEGLLGQVEVWAKSESGSYRARVRVLPADLRIALERLTPTGGVIRIDTRHALLLTATAPDPVVRCQKEDVAVGLAIRVTLLGDAPAPASLKLSLRNREGAEVAFSVPFPIETPGFFDATGRLSADAVVSVDRLAHLTARALSPRAQNWSVDLTYFSGRTVPILSLRETAGGVREVALEPLRAALQTALAESPELDDQVQLKLMRGADPQAIVCAVKRYDAEVAPVQRDGHRCVVLDEASKSRFGPAILLALRAVVVPLSRPGEAPVGLQTIEPGVWSVDELQPGSWLVLVYQGDYLRARPLRVQGPPGDEVPATNAIDRAVAIPDKAERRAALPMALNSLPDDTSAPGWRTVQAQLGTLGHLPATTFDLVREVARVPRVAVLTLLDSGADAAALWYGLEELPFLWAGIPLRTWLAAIDGWTAALREAGLASQTGDLARWVGRLAPGVFGKEPLVPFLPVFHEAAYLRAGARARRPDLPEPPNRLLAQPGARQFLATMLESEHGRFLERHPDGDRGLTLWPSEDPWPGAALDASLAGLQRLLTGQAHRQPVLACPLHLAQRIVARDELLDPAVLISIRRLRDFDPEWFDFAFAAACSLILGRRFDRKEWPFDDDQ